MKAIPLTQGKVALVDDADFERLNNYQWYAQKQVRQSRTTWYAVRHSKGGTRRLLRMHREILSIVDPKVEVDHVDGNGLDNRRRNIRAATSQQNNHNRRKRTKCSSIFKGVCWLSARGKWRAHIEINGHTHHIGYFDDEQAAARAYDEAARHLFREFAFTNQ